MKKKLRLPDPVEMDKIEEIEVTQKGMEDMPAAVKLPSKPKKGELLLCQLCGHPIYPRMEPYLSQGIPPQLFMNEDRGMAKHEYVYHIHWNCQQWACEELDAKTPGVMAERRDFLEQLEHNRRELSQNGDNR